MPAVFALVFSVFCLSLFFFPSAVRAQISPVQTVEEEVVAFAWAPDGRLVYAVKRIVKRGRVDMQRDDVWMLSPGGERKRIVNGEKLVKSATPFSYAIQSLLWSPDGLRLTADLFTSQVIDEKFNTHDSQVTLLLDQNGKEINIAGAQSVIDEAEGGAWLPDGVSVGYLTEAVKPRLLFHVNIVRPVSGRGSRVFGDFTFSAVAWDLRMNAPNAAVAVERDAALRGPFRLVWLDLTKETRRELATLAGFVGALTISPDGKLVAYFTDPQTLEIRDTELPERFARVAVAQGALAWDADSRRLLLKRGSTDPRAPASRRTGPLAWIAVPALEVPAPGKQLKPVEVIPQPILSGLSFREFALSRDGKWIAVTEPGSRHLKVFALK